jgi:hypothetical protein
VFLSQNSCSVEINCSLVTCIFFFPTCCVCQFPLLHIFCSLCSSWSS